MSKPIRLDLPKGSDARINWIAQDSSYACGVPQCALLCPVSLPVQRDSNTMGAYAVKAVLLKNILNDLRSRWIND